MPRIVDCPLGTAVELIRDWWTLEILHELIGGHHRIDELTSRLDIDPNTLRHRLDALTDRGLVEVVAGPDGSEQTVMASDLGAGIAPVLLGLAIWGQRQLGADHGLRAVNASTGNSVNLVLVDSVTGVAVDPLRVRYRALGRSSTRLRDLYTEHHALTETAERDDSRDS